MPLTVRLAGYNVDADLLRETVEFLRALDRDVAARISRMEPTEIPALVTSFLARITDSIDLEAFTPETLSAAYARISRDPKPVSELRRVARHAVARARKSNDNIIFGFGHASVAEHACFNIDVLGLSRLAAEELQLHRLVSFTEKSQRYITLSADFVIPPELADTPWEARLRSTIPAFFADYEEAFTLLMEKYREQAPGGNASELETRAKEDARYLLPLCCATQMGITMNARSIEYIVRDFSDHPLAEVRELGIRIREAVAAVAPSLIKYTTRGSYPRANRRKLTGNPEKDGTSEIHAAPSVRLIDRTPDGEELVLRALGFAVGMPNEIRNSSQVWHEVFKGIQPHDGVFREFELSHMTFECEMSASCFAQLKRHRMMTILSRPYRSEDGVIRPPSFTGDRLTRLFDRRIGKSRELAAALADESPLMGTYLLTNANVRRAMIHLNARELYHIAQLRCDLHAQWEIRMLADQIMELARREWPNLLALAVGAHEFEEAYRKRYSDS
ncbi:MAG: FAD-dependent thymidylate synthase [bacterium]|nr:FAD-dependent thymidylate synthase [bacterium]